MLEHITPVILTYNEAPNIARVLDHLTWAKRVVVVDSYSNDNTIEILKKYQNVDYFQRKFDRHANQWNYAIRDTAIDTPWILALDADYILTDEFVEEIAKLVEKNGPVAYRAAFKYCVYGHVLRGSLYPPVTVLFKKGHGKYEQDGHTQRLVVASGGIGNLSSYIHHDDRKSIAHWLQSQYKYMTLETPLLYNTKFSHLSLQDKLRRLIVLSPLIIVPYCLFYKGLIFDGKPGLMYTMQRLVAELILSLCLLTRKIEHDKA